MDNEITSTPTEEVASQNGSPDDSAQVVSYKRVQAKTVMVDRVVRVSLCLILWWHYDPKIILHCSYNLCLS